MDECLVARKATAIIKRTLARAKRLHQPALGETQSSWYQASDQNSHPLPPSTFTEQSHAGSDEFNTMLQSDSMNSGDLTDSVADLDWLTSYPTDDDPQALFWIDWAHELDTLGT